MWIDACISEYITYAHVSVHTYMYRINASEPERWLSEILIDPQLDQEYVSAGPG